MAVNFPFLRDDSAFDPEHIQAMSTVLDDVCEALSLPETAKVAREVIAVRIIELGHRGERSPTVLRDRVLKEAGLHEVINGYAPRGGP